ncbi:N-acetyltransferase [Macrococcus brunensis]|uniref:N-acetyltransferase n=1 Tax=Macrococcus brunensis TaxID=198483 RepID=A0A4R6BGI9_9STAP|nr:GNAT family N-acetyltransferase [Macrococcus brunensis]TDL99027.1 N-acetyltransferase [Macrococcus brunensis]
MIREFKTADMDQIQAMNKAEGWDNLVARHEQTLNSWQHSIAYVMEIENEIVGCIRALTDGYVSLYVCELIVREDVRGKGYGRDLLNFVHDIYPSTRMELLATASSKEYYAPRFRPFYGFRRTYHEDLRSE